MTPLVKKFCFRKIKWFVHHLTQNLMVNNFYKKMYILNCAVIDLGKENVWHIPPYRKQ